MKDIRTSYNYKRIENRLRLFYLTKNMFNLFREDIENEELLNNFIVLWNYYKEMWEFDLLSEIGSFIGCSHEHRAIYKVLNAKILSSDTRCHE